MGKGGITLMDFKDRFNLWLANVPESDPLHAQLLELQENEGQMREHFFQDMHFGTAGLRGVVGAGTNCMNVYTVGRATRGIAQYIIEAGPEAMDKGVIIAHDPRHFSKEFSRLKNIKIFRSSVYTFYKLNATALNQIETVTRLILGNYNFTWLVGLGKTFKGRQLKEF